jgi:NTP pyrophosphatase (non-canonical NTP hydrolase)
MNHFNNLTPVQLERLALLSEELGEAQQAIGKILRHGYTSHHPDLPNRSNLEDLEKELGHIMNAQKLMVDAGDISLSVINHYQGKKESEIHKYLHHQ